MGRPVHANRFRWARTGQASNNFHAGLEFTKLIGDPRKGLRGLFVDKNVS